jgi:hypothetical protein
MEKTLKLTGPKAVVAIVVIIAVAAFQLFSRKQTLQTQAVEAIKTHLVSEYARYHLPELQRATTDGSLTEERAEEIVGQLTQDNIDIVSISARGHGGRYVARVEVSVAGSEPPDGKPVRYLRMTHSSLIGWRVLRDTGAWNYYLTF